MSRTWRSWSGLASTTPRQVVRPTSPDEVADVFETPWDFLMNVANHRRDSLVHDGMTRWYWAMPWQERYIWGATAGMLKGLHDRLYGAASAEDAPCGTGAAVAGAAGTAVWLIATRAQAVSSRLTALSGRPTMLKMVGPSAPINWTSTSTRRASTPSKATVTTRATMSFSHLSERTNHEPKSNSSGDHTTCAARLASMSRIASHNSFTAASVEGKCPRFLVTFRSW